MAKWDWYQSTAEGSCPSKSGLIDLFLSHWEHADLAPARNLNGYTHGAAIKRGDTVLCHLNWGGQPGINCKATSDESPTLAKALKAWGKPHFPTRVDSAVDWYQEGLFDKLAGDLIAYAQDNRLAINQMGDWVRSEGRTLYLGSKDSAVRLVLYEKTAERRAAGCSAAPDHWVRLEVRVRPKKAHRASVARWEPDDALTAGWVADALNSTGYWTDLVKTAVGTVWRSSDDERARNALLRQYGAVMARWAAEAGGWDGLGLAIGDAYHSSGSPANASGATIADEPDAGTQCRTGHVQSATH